MSQRQVKAGIISRQPCVDCGAPETKTEIHHTLYPDQFVWVCKQCHATRERLLREQGKVTPIRDCMFAGMGYISPERWRQMVQSGLVLLSDWNSDRAQHL